MMNKKKSTKLAAPPKSFLSRRGVKGFLFLVVLTALCSVSFSVFARDRDGTKIQARSISRATRHSDSLTPPDDIADWYYIKVDSKGHVRLTLETTLPLTITVYNSSNESKWNRSGAIGMTSVSLDVEPGIYFIAIEAPANSKPVEMPYNLKVD